MREFIKLNRVCVPLSLDCDLSCKYCYRARGRLPVIPDFNDLMKEFLGQLDPTKVQAVVASGGEPLLHWDKVIELFSYVPKGQHKKVMTNGINLTQEIVDYLNENKIEVYVSHDGDVTEWLRGVDVLDDPELFDLIMQIEHLTFSCCCTAKNPDPWKNFQQIKARFPRQFYFHFNAVIADKYLHPELVEGFDYRAYRDGSMHCALHDVDWHNPIRPWVKGTGCNVLPNGDLVGMAEIHHKYGNVLSTPEEIFAKQQELGDAMDCDNLECPVHFACYKMAQNKSEHFCAYIAKKIEVRHAIKHKEREFDDSKFCL